MTNRLLKFKFYGIKNIEKEISIDFFNEYPSKKSLESESHIKALYGPNGSGKTAVCLALHYYKKLCTNSRFLATDESKAFSFAINKKTKKFYCEVTFYAKYDGSNLSRIYKHIIEVASKKGKLFITKEELYYLGARKEPITIYLYSHKKNLYERSNDEIMNYAGGELLSSISARVSDGAFEKENSYDYVNKNFDIFAPNFFSLFLLVEFGEKNDIPKDYSFLDDTENESIKQKILRMATATFDLDKLGFDEIIGSDEKQKFENRTNKLCEFVKKMKPTLMNIKPRYSKLDIGKGLVGVNLEFVYEDARVDLKYESSGVKKIVRLFDLLNSAKNKTTVAVVDEIDADVHDLFLCCLLDYFIRYTNAQLFITTHNIDLMANIKSLKHSIDFLSQDNVLTSWVNNGKKSPKKNYLNGMVSHIPFNLFSSDFAEIFNAEE